MQGCLFSAHMSLSNSEINSCDTLFGYFRFLDFIKILYEIWNFPKTELKPDLNCPPTVQILIHDSNHSYILNFEFELVFKPAVSSSTGLLKSLIINCSFTFFQVRVKPVSGRSYNIIVRGLQPPPHLKYFHVGRD